MSPSSMQMQKADSGRFQLIPAHSWDRAPKVGVGVGVRVRFRIRARTVCPIPPSTLRLEEFLDVHASYDVEDEDTKPDGSREGGEGLDGAAAVCSRRVRHEQYLLDPEVALYAVGIGDGGEQRDDEASHEGEPSPRGLFLRREGERADGEAEHRAAGPYPREERSLVGQEGADAVELEQRVDVTRHAQVHCRPRLVLLLAVQVGERQRLDRGRPGSEIHRRSHRVDGARRLGVGEGSAGAVEVG
mmetsp:Transcript_47978/g.102494  ORF Transcript_47978/g.102494 Transcript_47978/m.102494 type:complete len:244 (+) Transcript_47978:73-804(+)